ncbi:MAG: diguanylate cyclase [Planctomycetota bacterium]
MRHDELDSRGDQQPLVLIVDDDADMVHLVERLLQGGGYRTISADDGPAGVTIVEQYSPDVVLFNLDMPGMNGDVACREIRSKCAADSTSIIIFTAAGWTADMINRHLDAGANDFLRTPFTRVDLLTRVRVVLRAQLAQNMFRKLAILDPATKLLNRWQFFNELKESIAAARTKAAECILVLADIDNLAAANERFGYDLGDEAILTLSRLLRRFATTGCKVGRVGGDGFAVVINDSTREQAVALCNRIRRTFASVAFDAEAEPKHLTAGFGLASFRGDAHNFSADDFMLKADVALYAAKQLGRGRLATHWDMDAIDPANIPAGKRHARAVPRHATQRASSGLPDGYSTARRV